MSTAETRISAVVITCNDADVLEPCLESVASWVDELVVVDMHSDDGSRELALKYGAALHDHERIPFVEPARNHAMSLASCEWVLVVDPDERIQPGLADEVRRLARGDRWDVVLLPRVQFAFGRRLDSPGGQDGAQPRFFRRGVVRWPEQIHAHPDLSGLRCLDLSRTMDWKARNAAILHETWRSPHQVLEKLARYVPRDAERRLARGDRFSFSAMRHAMYSQFRKGFVEGRACEDGLPGFLYAALFVVQELAVYGEMWEQQGRPAEPDEEVKRWSRHFATARRGLAPVRLVTRAARKARRTLAPGGQD